MLAAKNKYPPENYEMAISIDISQYEMWTDDIDTVSDSESVVYSIEPPKVSMVSEAGVGYRRKGELIRNGYIADIIELQRTPYDRPICFIKLFDVKMRMALIHIIQSITENATKIVV